MLLQFPEIRSALEILFKLSIVLLSNKMKRAISSQSINELGVCNHYEARIVFFCENNQMHNKYVRMKLCSITYNEIICLFSALFMIVFVENASVGP